MRAPRSDATPAWITPTDLRQGPTARQRAHQEGDRLATRRLRQVAALLQRQYARTVPVVVPLDAGWMR